MSVPQVKLARAMFERLVTPERTRAMVSLSELRVLPWPADTIDDVLGALASARLVVSRRSGSPAARGASQEQARIKRLEQKLQSKMVRDLR